MLKRFGFRRKKHYLCRANRREPANARLSPSFYLKIKDFYLRDRKIYLRDKIFFGLGRNFFGPSWCAQQPFKKFFSLQILNDIKVFRTKKIAF